MGCLYQTFIMMATTFGLAPGGRRTQIGSAKRVEPFIGAFALGE